MSCDPHVLASGKLDQLQWTDDGQILTISTIDGKYLFLAL